MAFLFYSALMSMERYIAGKGFTPMDEIDIWRTAKILIEVHGENAAMEAAMRADAACNENNPSAVAVWQSVMRSVEELRTKVLH